jgi:hypothetical protein
MRSRSSGGGEGRVAVVAEGAARGVGSKEKKRKRRKKVRKKIGARASRDTARRACGEEEPRTMFFLHFILFRSRDSTNGPDTRDYRSVEI